METRIRVQCAKEKDHAKILRLGTKGAEYAQELGELICGTSRHYINAPKKVSVPTGNSPIGCCAACGGELSFTIETLDRKPDYELPEFEFAGMSVRRTGMDDLEMAREWTEADEDHRGRVDPAFWCEQAERRQSYLLSDGDGPLYFFTGVMVTDTLEINVQFAPYEALKTLENRHALRGRIMRGLVEGMHWLEERMRGVVDEMHFESRSPDLIRFAVRKLGFEQREGLLVRTLQTAAVKKEI